MNHWEQYLNETIKDPAAIVHFQQFIGSHLVGDQVARGQVRDELDRLRRVATSMSAIQEVLATMLEGSQAETDWPLKDNHFIRGGLYDALSLLADSIDTATGRIDFLIHQ